MASYWPSDLLPGAVMNIVLDEQRPQLQVQQSSGHPPNPGRIALPVCPDLVSDIDRVF
jgi:hypothetical protein